MIAHALTESTQFNLLGSLDLELFWEPQFNLLELKPSNI
jgi:hypothetical protein